MAKFTQIIKEEEIENATITQICEAIAMSGEEIAKKLGVTRQYVSNTLKSAMRKIYIGIKQASGDGPFKVAITMANMLHPEVLSQDKLIKRPDGARGEKELVHQSYKDFFNLFPPDIRKEIEEDAKVYLKKNIATPKPARKISPGNMNRTAPWPSDYHG